MGCSPPTGDARWQFKLFGQQQFGRPEPLQFTCQGLPGFELLHREASTAQVQGRQSESPVLLQQRCEQVVPALLHQGLIGHGPGRDHPDHLAFHRTLAERGVADLFADGHRLTFFYQTGQVVLCRMVGDSRHGYRLTGGLAPFGEGNIQKPCSALGVSIKQLVEIPHAIKQQHVRILRLEAEILLHHWCV